MSHKARVGDVFLVPIDGTRSGLGQIAGDWKGELYVVIYDGVHLVQEVKPESVATERPLFAALSLDAKVHNGDWPIVGNFTANLGGIPQPVFKVDQGGQPILETRDRLTSRRATGREAEVLRLRAVVAPVRLENALKAHHGIGKWNAGMTICSQTTLGSLHGYWPVQVDGRRNVPRGVPVGFGVNSSEHPIATPGDSFAFASK